MRARYWRTVEDGRIECALCPRFCRLREGQRGFCFVRKADGGALVLDTYGRSSGFCVDPIEKKPLNHALPGSRTLSFGTAGCNLACKFCQNHDISKSRDVDRLARRAGPEAIAQAAAEAGCRSISYTYNDPVIFLEFAVDVAAAARALGLRNVAVTAGYIEPAPRAEFFAAMDAANIDLKAFDDGFYRRLTGAALAPVLETIEYAARETACWVELTCLLIPGLNDGDAEIAAMARWIAEKAGPDTPLHLTAFHPDYRLTDRPRTPPETVDRRSAPRRPGPFDQNGPRPTAGAPPVRA
jgi:pyruvate formate lyase activating enzyme